MNPQPDIAPAALLAGGTGLTGGHLLRELAQSRYGRVTALTRRDTPSPDPRVTFQKVDFESLPPLPPAADVYCALGTTIRKAGSRETFRRVDHGYPLAIARAARNAGARQFLVVSSVGADPRSPNFYLKVKGELEEALATLGFESLHIFRPGVLLGDRGESRPGESVGKALSQVFGLFLAGPMRRYRGMPASRLARAMVNAAARGDAGRRHVYHYDEIMRLD